ncbi:MAG: hypothetical protein ACFCUQ_22935 [Kiloniellales bacterium]
MQMIARRMMMPALIAAALVFGPSESRATECWTGWGYWIEAGSHRYKSERLLLVAQGATAWAPGQPVTLYFLDGEAGGIDESEPPITAIPASLRFSRWQRLPLVTGIAVVAGRSDHLTFGLSHITQLVTGIERLDDFYRWACGRSQE